MSSPVRLDRYDNSRYNPGRGVVVRALWLFLGQPLLYCQWLPLSSFRAALLRLFGARIGRGVVIRSFVSVKYPWHLSIGDHCWIGERCWIDNLTSVTIADHVCVSQGVYFCPGGHDWTDPFFSLRVAPIRLEEASWVGARALLLAGLHLHRGAVLTAGTIAGGVVPPLEIYSGHPATFVRRRKLVELEKHMQKEAAFA